MNGNGEVFNYDADFLNNGNIATNQFNLQVEGDFNSEGNASGDFIWDAGNSLTVGGTASIAVNNFSNYGEISFHTIDAAVEGDFSNYGDISITQFDVTVEGDFSNYGEIIASVFDVTVEGDFISDNDNVDFNLNGGSLVVSGNVFITADDFENNATIDIANDFNATVRDFINHGKLMLPGLNVTASDFANNFQISWKNLNAICIKCAMSVIVQRE